jgi:RHS repeat-associated protein
VPVAVVANVTSTPILLMVHADHLKRPIRMTDATKAAVWSAIWKPFGEPHSLTATQSLDARFPGQWFQIETGLAYNWHRHYDPTTGRYTQPDPLGFPDGPSRYEYAGNNPIMKIDPRGLATNLGGSSHSRNSTGRIQVCQVIKKCWLQSEVPAPDGGYLCDYLCSNGSSMTVRTRSRRCPKTIDDDGFIPELL